MRSSPQASLPRLYLGIDAGGTKTSCVLMDASGRIRGRGQGPSANFAHLEGQSVVSAVREALVGALQSSGATSEHLTGAYICLAGYGPEDEPRARGLLDPLLHPARTNFGRDLEAALASACGSGPGLVVIAGTGSVAFGRSRTGETHRVGGWGYLVGDEGSGYWLGSAALRLTLQGFDGRAPRGLLFRMVSAQAAVESAAALRDRIYRERWRPGDIAAFAPIVVEAAAAAGDPEAHNLVLQAARELAALAAALLALPAMPTTACGLVGGLWKAGPILRTPFSDALRLIAPAIIVAEPAVDPAAGAALLALHEAGIDLRPEAVTG